MTTFAKRILADMDDEAYFMLDAVFDNATKHGEVAQFTMDAVPNVKWLMTVRYGGIFIQCKKYGFKKVYSFNSFLYRWNKFLMAFGTDVNDLIQKLDLPAREEAALLSIIERAIE